MDSFPFCPNPHCIWHSLSPPSQWLRRKGFYFTKAFGRVKRFQCKACGTTFSSQTYSLCYYLKKRLCLTDIAQRLSAGESLRAMGRNLGVAPKTIQNRLERLSRQAMAFHAEALRHYRGRDELCIDGMVSFDISQYFVSEIPIAITAHSQFILDFSHASRKRSGTMTESQKQKAARLYQEVLLERGAVSRSFKDMVCSALRTQPPSRFHPLILITDEKPEYQRVLHRWKEYRAQTEDTRIIHHTVWSKLPRTVNNPLFASNYIERELRKDMAAHHRETVCFNRNVANGMLRLGLYFMQHNYSKPFRIGAEQDKAAGTHAEAAGIGSEIVARYVEYLTGGIRWFLSNSSLSETMKKTWMKNWKTPGKQGPERVAKYVLA